MRDKKIFIIKMKAIKMNLNYTFCIALACIALSANTINCAPHIEHDDILAARQSLVIPGTDAVSSKYTKSNFKNDAGYVAVEFKPSDSLPIVAPVSVEKATDVRPNAAPKYTKAGLRKDADCVFVETSNTTDSLYHAEKSASQKPKGTWLQYIGNKSLDGWTAVCENTIKAFNSAIIIASKLSRNIFGYASTTTWF